MKTFFIKILLIILFHVAFIHFAKAQNVGIGTTAPQAKLDVNGDLKVSIIPNGIAGVDSILVQDNVTKIIKKIPANSFTTLSSGVLKTTLVVSLPTQNYFVTPSNVLDSNKVNLYRNGVLINFTVVGTNVISPEVICVLGDEIKIVQTL